jgi:hypothetical protein
MRHAARQLRAWLIFDVGRMKLFLLVLGSFLGGCSAVPGDAAFRSGHPVQAARLYESQYNMGSTDAGLRLASMLSKGMGIPQDETKAFAIWSDLAGRGVPLAFHNLGVCYEYGQGVAKDISKAEEAYRRGANSGVLWSIFNLGTLYSNGIAQKSDDVEGLALLLKAARLATGDSDSERLIRDDRLGHVAKMKARMTPGEIAAAEEASKRERPNKAPEPTPTAVTPRAMEMVIEVKQWNCNHDKARVAPAAVVAHLYQNVGGSRITDKISGSDL